MYHLVGIATIICFNHPFPAVTTVPDIDKEINDPDFFIRNIGVGIIHMVTDMPCMTKDIEDEDTMTFYHSLN